MRFNNSNQEASQRSDISCRSCRRRKVKCDRGFPRCLVCEQTSQPCSYPSGPLKPGPKIGSLQRSRKRPRENEAGNGERERNRSVFPRIDHTASENIENQNSVSNPASEELSEEEFMSSMVRNTLEKATSTRGREWNTRRIPDLSFILHPSHEVSSPEEQKFNVHARQSSDKAQQYAVIERTCSALGLRHKNLEQLIKAYFDNMVAIDLFHEPSFPEKLSRIASPTQISALLAAMLTFAVRFYPDGSTDSALQADVNQRAAHFLDLALKYIDEVLKECGDLTPPLCILQASIVAAHCQLSQGVLGRAWRSLGTCVRLAYEMNLHLIDTRGPTNTTSVDIGHWCEDEEKRRAWWAIWEMDVFATTIRRTPPAVDWSQVETLLPVENEYWFQRKPRPSSFLERDPAARWKALQASGNRSPNAWFIVINSLMKDAQRISSPRGVPSLSPANESQPDRMNEARKRLETIANAVKCFGMALPSHLRYHNQYLGFDARSPGQYTSLRQTHCSIYSIYMMTQLARLMIYRYDVFKGHSRVALSMHDSSESSTANYDRSYPETMDETESLAIKQYFEAADDMLSIVHRSCDDHIQYINPFLSNTIWLASAVHLMRSQFCRSETNKSVVKSRFEVMHLTFKKCVDFFNMHTIVQQNLGTLEEQLEACQRPDRNQENDTICHNKEFYDNMPGSTEIFECSSHGTRVDNAQCPPCSYLPSPNTRNNANAIQQDSNTSNSNQFLPSPPSSHAFHTTDLPEQIPYQRTLNSSPSMLDFMHLPAPAHIGSTVDNGVSPSSATLIDPVLFSTTQPQGPFAGNARGLETDLDWRHSRLQRDLEDMLSGMFT